MVAFVVGLCVINIALWIIFIFRFKRIFSTDSIIEKTRNVMNRMVSDMNRNTETAINLTEEANRKLKNTIKESENILQQFSEATDRLRGMIAETERLSSHLDNEPVVNVSFRSNGAKNPRTFFAEAEKSYRKNSLAFSNESEINPEDSYELSQNSMNHNSKNGIIHDEVKVTSQGAAYKEVPVIKAKLFDETLSAKKEKKSINEEVRMLYDEGLNADEIAMKLSVSITEVQLIIDMMD